MKKTIGMVLSALMVAVGFVAVPAMAQAAPSADAPVVISQVYGGGGNAGAVYAHDFVELHNPGDSEFDLAGWSVQYASAAGSSWVNKVDLSGSIAAGGFYLIQLAAGNNTTLPALPTPDLTGSINLAGGAGKVALVNSTTVLSGAVVSAEPSVIDLVGYGSNASDFAGEAGAPGLNNSTAAIRIFDDGVAQNTPDNSLDFVAGAPAPRNSGPVDEDDDEEEEEEEPTPPAVVTIAEIQGTGDATPLAGETVTTSGIVTAHYPTGGFRGYVIQTPGTGGLDADEIGAKEASNAVFVFSDATVNSVEIGDYVEVTGTPQESFGLTQLVVESADDLTVLTESPEPVVATEITDWAVTASNREAFESELLTFGEDFTISNTFATNTFGEVGLAVGDSPLVQPTHYAIPGSSAAAAIADDNFARGLTLDDGNNFNFTTGANRSLTPVYLSLDNPIRVGAPAELIGEFVLDWRFDLWRAQPTEPIASGTALADLPISWENTRVDAPDFAAIGGDVTVAAFNVLNYFVTLGVDTSSCVPWTDRDGNGTNVRSSCLQRGAWNADSFERQQEKIVSAINTTDSSVVGLMEIENSAVLGNPTDEAVATLVTALNAAAGSEKWAYVPSSADLPPLAQQDVITNAFIYQPAEVELVGASVALGTESEPFSGGTGGAFHNGREPLGQVFAPVGGGDPFLYVVNHFKSKGSPGPWPGDAEGTDGQGSSNESRVRQATALVEWVEGLQETLEVETVLIGGDLNSYGAEEPMQIFYEAGYASAEFFAGLDKTTYSFGGQSGSLDYILLNDAGLKRLTGADIWEINSGESIALEYSRYNNHGTLFHEPGPYRSSDHDPIIVGLRSILPTVLTTLNINDFHGRIDSNTVKFAGTIEALREAALGESLLISSGDDIGASLFASAVAGDLPTLEVLNALELDVAAAGNHEFDQGWPDLRDRVRGASNFEHLAANLYLTGTTTPALPEYEVFTLDGVRVAVIGAVTQETPSLVSPDGVVDVDFGDPVDAVNRVAEYLVDENLADVLIASYHEGAPTASSLENALAQSEGEVFSKIVNDTSASVSAILNGHTHFEYAWSAPVPGVEGATRPVIQSASYGTHVGNIQLFIDPETFDVIDFTAVNVPRTAVSDELLIASYPRVAAVAEIVADALAAAAVIGDQKVADVTASITTGFRDGSYVDGVYTGGTRDNRAAESTLGKLVANAMRDSLANLPDGAQIGVANPGGLRAELFDTQAAFGGSAVAGLADGEISFSQANSVLPFTNTLSISAMPGSVFTQLLEQQWRSAAYLQLGLSDNVTYTFDAGLPEGSRITSVTIDGEPLDPDAIYQVGTFNFLSAGGDNFHAFTDPSVETRDTGYLDWEAWINYLGENSPLSPDFARSSVEVNSLPATVVAGQTIEFTVSSLDLTSLGSPANTALTVELGGAPYGVATVTNGAAEVSVTVPAGTPAGSLSLTLVAEPSGTTVQLPLTVLQSTTPPVTPPTDPETEINPEFLSGPTGPVQPGDVVTISATGFIPGEPVLIQFQSTPVDLTTVLADDTGSFTTQVQIPLDATPGLHHIVAIGLLSGAEVSWPVEVAGSLSTTGGDAAPGLIIGGVLFLLGIGFVAATRLTGRKRDEVEPV